MLDFKKLND